MANIDYTKVGWDTTKSLGPTNLNHMDDGIKSVCDKMDNIGDEVMGYEVTSSGPSHQIINATNATNATNDGTGTNIANQFTELSNKITSQATWKNGGSSTGGSVNFPSEYNEVNVFISSSGTTFNRVFPKGYIETLSGNTIIREGYYQNTSNYGMAYIVLTSTKAQCTYFNINGTDSHSSAAVTVFYR